uniref:Uncharacterized protein n=2 Tax=Tetranychus urticae TaxID=32264 RepID=T1KYM0_TETUR
MQIEINEEPVLPPRYEYLGVIRKKFPWGDGIEPLFGWPRGRSPAEYAARREAGLPMPDLLDDLPDDDDED